MTNNDILKKLRVALHLRNEEIIAICRLVDFRITKSELGALFRTEDHPNYKACGDQILRNFLNGLVIYLRGKREEEGIVKKTAVATCIESGNDEADSGTDAAYKQQTIARIYKGELEGQGTLMQVTLLQETNPVTYGLETVRANLGGKAGEFVLEHRSTVNDAEGTTAKIISGSGTQQLANIEGVVRYTSVKGSPDQVSVEYYFSKKP